MLRPCQKPRTLLSIMRLILFDIDGTLLWTDGAGRRAIHRALLDEMGTAGPIDGYRFDGKTDPQIVRELLEMAGHPEHSSEDRITAVCRRYVDLLTVELAKPSQTTRIYPGINDLLTALEPYEADDRALVGLLTGNVVNGATLKLRSAGLDPDRFAVGAFGSDSHRRSDLPAIAAKRAAERTGRRFRGDDIVVVGDTPDDVACARPIGTRTVGVATGFFDTKALRAAGATHVFENLEDTKVVLEALLS
jgi:phosphoglycolate phosphatase